MGKTKEKQEPTISKRKSRAEFSRPDEIVNLITPVNFLPDNSLEIEKMMFDTISSFADKLNRVSDSDESGELFFDKFHHYFEAEVLDYLYDPDRLWDFKEAYRRFFGLNTAKQVFLSVIKANKKTDRFLNLEGFEYFKLHKAEKIRKEDVMDQVLKNDRKVDLFKFLFEWREAIEKGKSAALFDLAAWLHSPKPNFDRLRACEICNKIFWASREEKKTCDARCYGALRTRLYRTLTDEEKAARKAQREAYKAHKQRLKRNKEQK